MSDQTHQYDQDWALLVVQFESIVRTVEKLGGKIMVNVFNVERDAFQTARGERDTRDDTPDGVFINESHPFWSKRIATINHEPPHTSTLTLYTDDPPTLVEHPEWHGEHGIDGLYADTCYACHLEKQRLEAAEAAA